MQKYIFSFLLALTIIFTTNPANAAKFKQRNFFASLRAKETNLRTGPGMTYPIKYVYKIRSLPVKVIGEYESWYKIEDKDDDNGWINKTLITKKKTAIIINGTAILFSSNNEDSHPIYRLEEDLVVRLYKCKKEWCKIKAEDRKGWVKKEGVWGNF